MKTETDETLEDIFNGIIKETDEKELHFLIEKAKQEWKKKAKKEMLKDEIEFLESLRKILNNHHSHIPLVELGRQNVLNDVDNELKLDERLTKLKKEQEGKLT